MKKFIDRLFGKSKRCVLGTMRLISPRGSAVTVTKEMRYTVNIDGAKVYLNGYEDLVHYCRNVGIKYPNGRSL